MPKKPPPVATEKEMDDWMKERGYGDLSGAPGSVAAGTAGKVPPATNTINQFIEDYPLIAGVGQGVAGYGESIPYYLEKGVQQFKPDFQMPLHERAADIQKRVESTSAGRWGEVGGIMAPAFLPSGALGRAMSELRMPELLRLARTWEDMGPGLRGMTQGAVGGLVSNPAKTPQEAWDQLTMGGLLGGVGGAAAGQLGAKTASKTGKEAMKAWADAEEVAQATERENVAKTAMRYTGRPEQHGTRRDFSNIERFAPEPQTEPRTPRDILRERTKREKAEKADTKREPETYSQKLARTLGKGAAFTLGHLTTPHPLQRVMGHVYSAAFDDALARMNKGEGEALKDYIDTFLAGRGRRKTFAPRGAAAAGAFGSATRENDPTQWVINPIEPLPGTPGAR